MTIRTLERSDIDAVRELAALARNEGFQFLDRLVAGIENEIVRLDAADEFFLCVTEQSRIIAVGGITPDPYASEPDVGRVRHVYVHPDARRSGIGRALIVALEQRAPRSYATLRLRTDTPAAAQFYEALGYHRVIEVDATHVKPTVRMAVK